MMNKNKYRLICFDMDGVIFSSEKILVPAYQDSIQNYIRAGGRKLAVPAAEDIFHLVGQPVDIIFSRLFPDLPAEDRQQLNQGVLESLVRAIGRGEGALLSGIRETLEDLGRDHALAVASNGRRAYLEAILEYYELAGFFLDRVCISPEFSHKGLLLREYARRGNYTPADILMVGDRKSDWDAARFIECDFLGVDYGHGDPGELDGAGKLAKNPSDITGMAR